MTDKVKKNMGCNCCKFHGNFGGCFSDGKQIYHYLHGKCDDIVDSCSIKNSNCECQDFKISILKYLFGKC